MLRVESDSEEVIGAERERDGVETGKVVKLKVDKGKERANRGGTEHSREWEGRVEDER